MVHDYRTQRVLDLPLYGKKTFLLYRKLRYRCISCGKQIFESNTFLPGYAHTTNRLFLKLFEELHTVSSQKNIVQHYAITPMRIRRLLDATSPGLPDLPEILGIDEFNGNSNKTKYHCILTNLEMHKPIDIFSNRTEASLIHHFRKYQNTPQLKRVKVIVIDMWRTYYTILRSILPDAIILIDNFHMVCQVMWCLENFRKRVQKEMSKSLRIYFKHSRKVLLKRSDKLVVNSYINEPMILDRLLRYIPDLKRAYELKETLLHIAHEDHTPESTRLQLNQWIQTVKNPISQSFTRVFVSIKIGKNRFLILYLTVFQRCH